MADSMGNITRNTEVTPGNTEAKAPRIETT